MAREFFERDRSLKDHEFQQLMAVIQQSFRLGKLADNGTFDLLDSEGSSLQQLFSYNLVGKSGITELVRSGERGIRLIENGRLKPKPLSKASLREVLAVMEDQMVVNDGFITDAERTKVQRLLQMLDQGQQLSDADKQFLMVPQEYEGEKVDVIMFKRYMRERTWLSATVYSPERRITLPHRVESPLINKNFLQKLAVGYS